MELGHPDGKNDKLLHECFIKPEYYRSILNFEKFIVVGRRGTGKTALINELIIDYNEDENIVIKLDNFVELELFIQKRKNTKIGVLNFIGYKIVQFFENKKEDLWSKRPKSIKKAIQELNLKKPTKFQKSISRIKGFGNKFAKVEFNIESDEIDIYYLSDFGAFLDQITNFISNKDLNLIILFDELDKLKGMNYKEIVTNLMEFSYDVYSKFTEFHSLLFLRRDVYELLTDFHLLPQLRMNIVTIDEFWTNARLQEMITKRFEYASNHKIGFDNVFPPKEKIRVRKSYAWDYLMQRTFRRPREIISFSEYIYTNLQKIKFNDELYSKKYREIIYNSEKDYSEGLRSEILIEHNLRLKIIYKTGTVATQLITIFQGEKEINDYNNITEKISKLNVVKTNILSVKKSLEELFLMGVIGMDLGKNILKHKGFFHYNPQLINKFQNYNGRLILHHGLRFNLLPSYGASFKN